MNYMKKYYDIKDIKQTLKPEDAFVTVYLVDPIAVRFLHILANYTKITPNQISLLAFVFGVISALLFYLGHFWIGAISYYLSFLFDCMDGKLARLKKISSDVGFFYDASTLTHAYVLSAIALHFLFVEQNKLVVGLIGGLFLIQLQKSAMTIALKSVIPTLGSVYGRYENSLKNSGKLGLLIRIYSKSFGRSKLIPTEIDLEFFTIISFAYGCKKISILLLALWLLYEFMFVLVQFFISVNIIKRR